IATSWPGTGTASASQVVVPQFAGATELGARVALPKFTRVLISSPVPVMVNVKFPLPAATLTGEMETMFS
ncbi:MAG TPA: hypothetical protein VIH67_01735, partial [Candidatus Acidoferrum sp.]